MTFHAKEIGNLRHPRGPEVIDLREVRSVPLTHVNGSAQEGSPHAVRRSDLAARAADVVAVAGGAVVAALATSEPVWVYAGVGVVLLVAVLVITAAPSTRLTLGALDELPTLAGRLGLATVIVSPVVLLADAAQGALVQVLLTIVLLAGLRGLTYTAIRRGRKRGVLLSSTLVIGAGDIGAEITHALYEHRELGLAPIGFVDDDSPVGGPRLLGGVDDLEQVLERSGARHVIVAFGRRRELDLVAVLRRLAELDVVVHVVPRFFDIGVAPAGPGVDDAWGIPLYRLPRAGQHRFTWAAKRVLDVTLASVVLVVTLPVMLVVCVAVRMTSPGGALFRQRRTGQDGEEFALLKLRSLRQPEPADGVGLEVVAGAEDDLDVQAARLHDVANRHTRVGDFLRRTCLDEAPQLWNVLVGEMSLVGPRPEEVRFVDHFSDTIPGYGDRHRTPGGLTGWAQVNGLRGPTSIVERARFDNRYIEDWTLWRDVVILMRTTGAVLRSISGRFIHPTVSRSLEMERHQP